MHKTMHLPTSWHIKEEQYLQGCRSFWHVEAVHAHTKQAYSPEEKQNASAVGHRAGWFATHFDVTILLRMLFHMLTFTLVFSMWALKGSMQSRVTLMVFME